MEDTLSNIFSDNKIKQAERRQQVELNEQLREQERLGQEQENASFWEKLGATVLDIFTELGGGLLKLVEGVVDAGVSIAGGVGGIFGADTKWAEDIVKFDATQEWYFGEFEDDLTQHSYLNDAPIVKDIVRGVGQQLPTITAFALAPFTGGASLAAVPYTVGATIASAGGGGVEEAINEGAEFGQAFAYGLLQSGIEGAVEIVTAGMGKGVTSIGKAIGKSTTKSVAKTIGKKTVEEGLSEFVEEGLSALLNPLTKTTYQGVDALETYRDLTFYLDVGKQALVGGIVGGITGGAGATVTSKMSGGKSGYSISQSISEISNLDKQENLQYQKNKLKTETLQSNEQQRQAEYKNISDTLKAMSETERSKAIEKYKLEGLFDSNGEINENLLSNRLLTQTETSVDNGDGTQGKALISPNLNAITPNLRNQQLLFQPTSNTLTENSTKAKKFLMTLDKNSRSVFTDDLPSNVNAFYDTRSKVLYLSNEVSSKQLMGHEITHSLEGTKEFTELKEYIVDNLKNSLGEEVYNEMVAQKIEQYKDVNVEAKQGDNGKFVAFYEAETEIVADEMGKLLTNPASVKRIVNQNKKGKAYRIWRWIKDSLAKLVKKGEKGEYYTYLRNAEKLYANAIKASIGGISLSQVRSNVDDAVAEFERNANAEASESLANDGDLRYNKDYTKHQYNDFGWVRANNVLSARQWQDFNAKFSNLNAEVKSNKTTKGEYMIAVSDMQGDKFGVDNAIVFVKGTFENPKISKIIKINLESETDIEIVRSEIYDREKSNWTRQSDFYENLYGKELVREYSINDVGDYKEYKNFQGTSRGGQESQRIDSNNPKQQIGRGTSEDSRYALGKSFDNEDFRYNKRYTQRDVEEVTEKDFKHHYWAVSNDVVSEKEIANFTKKIAELKNGTMFNKNIDGFYMIPVGEKGIENKIVFTDGNFERPSINYVVSINSDNETDLSIYREEIYVSEIKGVQTETGNLFKYDHSKDYDYSKFNESIRSRNGKFGDRQQIGRGTSEDIRYALKENSKDYKKYSKGQTAKYVAERSKNKAYSRSDAEKVINTIVSQNLSFGDKYGELSNKTKEQVIDKLWHAYNTRKEGYDLNMLDDIAEFIINNAVVEDVYQNEIRDGKIDYATYIVDNLKNYIQKVNLDSLKSEISYKYDKSQAKIYSRWGKRKGTYGSSPDQIAQELQNFGITFESNVPSDILFEMNDMWENAMGIIKQVQKEKLTEVRDGVDLAELKTKIRDELLLQEDNVGHKTKFAETIEKYTSKITNLKNTIKEIKRLNKAKNDVVSSIERLRDEFIKNKPAGWKTPEQVINFVKKITKMETWRNDISKDARGFIRDLENGIDSVMDEQQQSIYPFRETIKEISSGQGELNADEMIMLDKMLTQFIWQLKHYDKVHFQGQNQSITDIATKGVEESKQAKKIIKKRKLWNKFTDKVYTNPAERFEKLGLYQSDAVMTMFFADIKEGDRRRATFVRDADALFKEFFKDNKNYLNELQNEITIGEGENRVTITKRQALSIYATSLREQGRKHLFNMGYDYGVIRLLDNKLSTQGKMKEAFAEGRDIKITQSMIAEIEKSFTNADREYLEVTSKFFNEMSKKAKIEVDKKLYGITNVENDNYFPIKVSSDKIYTEIGNKENNINHFVLEMGMNKSTKSNAKNKIVIDGIDSIVVLHIRNMSMYYGFALPINAYNRIMNKSVENLDNLDQNSTMRSEIAQLDSSFENYADKLFKDIQGISNKESGFISSILSYIRWAGANAALGLNTKVLSTQTLSLASAISEFNPKYVAKGLAHFFGEKHKQDLAKYSPLMWERMEIGNSVDIAEIRQVGKGKLGKMMRGISNLTTKPISWMDSNVIQSLWFASQYEIADRMGAGYEFGTEANKIEAGKRLDEVVFRTQQTSDALGRSEWMRSQNEFVKFARMFTGDTIQLAGKLLSSIDKHNIAKRMIKSGDPKLVEAGKKLLSKSRVELAKSGSAFLLNQIMLLAIAMAFKWIKGLGDDEEWSDVAKNEVLANLFGLIPFGGDIYDKFLGYEPTNMAYTALSDTAELFLDLYNDVSGAINGDYQDPIKRNSIFRKTILNMSKIFGLPLQNLESYTKGIVEKFSPSTIEEYESWFKTKSNSVYYKKIQQATESGNEDYAETIINIMFASRTGKIKDDKVLDETRLLIEKGYDILPRNISKTVTYNGEQHSLTNSEHNRFVKLYSEANEVVVKLVNNVNFNRLDDKAKAKAMNMVYDYYYNLALEDFLGEDLDNKTMLFAEVIPIELLAIATSQARIYEADIDENGNAISGTKKAKIQNFIQSLKLSAVQKYMIMGYLGYSNKFGDALVKSYINRQDLTKEEKSELYKMSGYAA